MSKEVTDKAENGKGLWRAECNGEKGEVDRVLNHMQPWELSKAESSDSWIGRSQNKES